MKVSRQLVNWYFQLVFSLEILVIANSERDLLENADSISHQWQPYTESLLPCESD